MPPPRHLSRPRLTEKTRSLNSAPELTATHGGEPSLLLSPCVSTVCAKTPRAAAKAETLYRAGSADMQESPIVSPSHNGGHTTRCTRARGNKETLKSTGVSTGRGAPLSFSLTAGNDRETTARVRPPRSSARARSAEPRPCSFSQTYNHAVSVRFASSPFAGGNREGFRTPRHFAQVSRPASAHTHLGARPNAYARSHTSEARDTAAAELQGHAVCGNFARDIFSTHSTTSQVQHPRASAPFAESAPNPGHPRNVAAFAAPSKDEDCRGYASLPRSPSSITGTDGVAGYSTDTQAVLDKPWLALPPAQGILKGTGRVHSTTRGASGAASSTASPSSSHRAHTPSSVPSVQIGGPSSRSLSIGENISVQESTKQARHVMFDEAAIKSLDASETHAVYDDSRLGRHPGSMECRTAVSSCAMRDLGRLRPPITTVAFMSKENAESWDTDSEWFNEEFGPQLTLVSATADSAKAAPTPSSTAAASGSPSLSSVVLISRPSGSALPSSPASLSPPVTTAATAGKAVRATTRQFGMLVRQPDEYDLAGNCQRPRTPPLSSSRTTQRTSAVMNMPHASVSFSLATSAGSNSGITGEISEPVCDDGRDPSPVLMYEHASFMASTRPDSHSVVAPPCLRSIVAPAPPLSVNDLRRRSPNASTCLVTTAALSERSGEGGPHRGCGRRSLTAPHVSPCSVEASLDKVAGSARSAPSTKQEAASAQTRMQAVAANQHDGEFPSLGAMSLSATEPRLLQPESQSNECNRHTDRTSTSFVTPSRIKTSTSAVVMVEIPRRTSSSGAGDPPSVDSISTSSSARGGVRGLRGTSPARGNAQANAVSPEVGQAADGGATSGPSTTSLRPRTGHPAAVGEAGSAYLGERTQVFGVQLANTHDIKAPPTAVVTTRAMNGNPGDSTVPRADSTSSALSPTLFSSREPAMPKTRECVSQTSRKNDTVTVISSVLPRKAQQSYATTANLHNRRMGVAVSQRSHTNSDDDEKDEDESEPHIQVPVPTPRAQASKSSWAVQRRHSDDSK